MPKIIPTIKGTTNKQKIKTPIRYLITSSSRRMSARGVTSSSEEFRMVNTFLHSYPLQRTTKDATPGLAFTCQVPSSLQCGQMRFTDRPTNATALAFSSSCLRKAACPASSLAFCSASFFSACSFFFRFQYDPLGHRWVSRDAYLRTAVRTF